MRNARQAGLPSEPTFRTLLPVLCAVWADGAMESDELAVVRAALADARWMSPRARSLASEWTDPDVPPAPTLYREAVEAVRAATADGRGTLTEAGLALGARARSDAATEDADWREAARETLDRLARELELAGGEPVRSIAGRTTRPPSAAEAASRPSALVEGLAAAIRGDEPELRARVRAAMLGPEFDFPAEMERGERRERVLAAVRALADRGFGSISYPRAFGGRERPAAAVEVFEELAYGDLSVLVKFGVQFGLFGGSLAQLGTERHRRLLPRVASLELAGCYAMTETGHGSNVRDIRTTATHDPESGGFRIHTPDADARKDYIGNAALHGRLATVFARLRVGAEDHGVHAFLVPIRDERGRPARGVEIEDCGPKVGLNGVDNGRLRFTAVDVPADSLLDRFAQVTADGVYRSPIPSPGRRFFTMLGTLASGRISIAAASLAVARKALVVGVRYAAERRQFGPEGAPEVPVLSYLDVQRRLIPRLARTYAATFAVRDLVRRFADPDADRRVLEARAAALKATASRHALDTLQACRETCGGQGYLAENQLGRMRADADVFTTFEGANPVLLQLVAKGLLSGFRRDMGDMGLWSIARRLAGLAGTRLVEMNPVTTRRTDADHLLDLDVQAAALEYRERRLLRSAARRLRSRVQGGMDGFDAVNECQDHLVALARAHSDRILLECSRDALERTERGPARELLTRTIALFGLATMESRRAWYLEKGYFEPSKSEAIRDQVNRLCRELAERAVDLVDGFGIPDRLVRAPIARARPRFRDGVGSPR